MKLVNDVHNWKKWWSMRFIILSTIFSSASVAWMALPYDWVAEIPGWVKVVLTIGAMVTAVGAGVARVVKQDKLEDPNDIPRFDRHQDPNAS